jgi:hypothetical protein
MTTSNSAVEGSIYRVQGPQTIADVERELTEIEAQRPLRLQVPVRPGKWWFGGEAALIQLLITWGRQHANATLVTHIGETEAPTKQLERLVSRPFGLVAVWMARDVTDRAGSRALKVPANRASEAEIDRMWFGRRMQPEVCQPTLWAGTEDDLESPEVASVGDRVFLASIDHHPRWRVPPCYFPTGKVRYRDDFVALANSMAKKATSGRGGSPITSDVRRPLGAILHELFKNTHEWARTDEDGVPLLRSVRGILAQGHSWAEQEAMQAADGSPALAEYLTAPGVRASGGRWRFLEVSVFDSGPGLARRWFSGHPGGAADPASPTPEEECQACVECFKRWNSSTLAGHKGLGLHEVMRTLSHLNAFFRVRTGRLSLYRDFVAWPYAGSVGKDCSLTDWTIRSGSLTPLALAGGVLYTMLIPIRGHPN